MVRAAIDIWCIPLGRPMPPSQADLELLSDDERARYARYRVVEPARAFAMTRIALRRLLAARLDRRPGDLRIEIDSRGKPRLSDTPGVFFNVSHDAELALVAVCNGAPVGIDVEHRSALAMDDPVVEATCTPSERAWLRANVVQVDDGALGRLWVRKEAVLKATGDGLELSPASLDLGDPAATAGVVFTSTARVVWCDLALPVDHVGAVALLSREVSAIDAALRLHTT